MRRLLWDEGNVAHIARHDVVPEEVEEVCHATPLVLDSYGGRYLVIGSTAKGRAITAVIEPEIKEPGTYYPITARSASKKEQRLLADDKED